MRRYVLIRALSIVPTLVGVSVAVFLMIRLIPGTIVEQMIGTEGAYSEQSMRALRAFFGLDQPLHVQYGRWLGRVLRGDLGTSWRTGLPVTEMIGSRLAVTLELTFGAMLIALAIGIPLGILSARRENTRLDHSVRVLSLFSLSIPVFWQATMLILATSLWLDWAPAVDFVSPWKDLRANLAIMALPSLALGTAVAAVFMRMTRSTLLEVMRQDYIRTARAKGLQEWVVLLRHALRAALIPIVSLVGIFAISLIGSSVLVEEVFARPGLGKLMVGATKQKDYTTLQSIMVVYALIIVIINLVVDIIYTYVDPRVRYG
jgi:peptide/nickel transport system permease protein